MALTTKLNSKRPQHRELQHVYNAITDGNAAALVSGVAGKRILIWRFHGVAAVKDKNCALLSGANSFPSLYATESMLCHHLMSGDGIPIYTCNVGENFNADPSDTTNWYFYAVYSIEDED